MTIMREGMWMACAFVAVMGLAAWDANRESELGLSDFEAQQALLARGLALGVGVSQPVSMPAQLLAGAADIEQKERVILLAAPAGASDFVTRDGKHVHSEALASALASGMSSVRLSRPQARALGLPNRIAMAGLATVNDIWIATVATAESLRDRQEQSQRRLFISLIVTAIIVGVFGGLAQRRQKRALALGHELRLAEAKRAATLGTLAMGIAHELSTPLGIIAGRAEQLRQIEHDKVKRGAATIVEQTEHISKVIRALLSLARGEGSQATPITPASTIRGAAELVAHVFEQAGVRLRVDAGSALPRVFGDAELLQHALVNLLLNACDAAEQAVALTAEARDDGVEFSVTDDGPGIPAELAARVTEPFFTTKPQGTGLGLAIVSEIVKAHRGRLSLVGTRASITLPREVA